MLYQRGRHNQSCCLPDSTIAKWIIGTCYPKPCLIYVWYGLCMGPEAPQCLAWLHVPLSGFWLSPFEIVWCYGQMGSGLCTIRVSVQLPGEGSGYLLPWLLTAFCPQSSLQSHPISCTCCHCMPWEGREYRPLSYSQNKRIRVQVTGRVWVLFWQVTLWGSLLKECVCGYNLSCGPRFLSYHAVLGMCCSCNYKYQSISFPSSSPLVSEVPIGPFVYLCIFHY